MDDAYHVNKKKRGAPKKPSTDLELFNRLVEKLDSFIKGVEQEIYEGAVEAITQLASRCRNHEQADRVEALFVQGRYTNLQLLVGLTDLKPLWLFPTTSGGQLRLVDQKLAELEANSVLAIVVTQLERFSRDDFLDCLLDAIAEHRSERSNGSVCLLLHAVNPLSWQRIGRETFFRLKTATMQIPSSDTLIDKLLHKLMREQPFSPLTFEGALLRFAREYYQRVDQSTRGLRKLLMLSLFDYCRGKARHGGEEELLYIEEGPLESDESCQVALRVIDEWLLGDLATYCDVYCQIMSDGFSSYYQELKGKLNNRWTKEMWVERLKQLTTILLDYPNMEAVAAESVRVREALEERNLMPKPAAVPADRMNLAAFKKDRAAKNAGTQLTITQKERIFSLLDSMLYNAIAEYKKEHEPFLIRLPSGIETMLHQRLDLSCPE